MRKYEIIFIVRPTVSEDESKKIIKKFADILTNNKANITDDKSLGQKELAYEINKFKSGYYHLFTIEANDDLAINEFDRQARNSSDIIRHLITKVED